MQLLPLRVLLLVVLLAPALAGCAGKDIATISVRCHVPPSSYDYLRADARLSTNTTALNDLCARAFGAGAHYHSEA